VSNGFDLVLRQVRLVDGRVVDVGVADGRFTDIAPSLPRADNDIDGCGKLLLPGLHDHHIHLLATAARMQSVDLSGMVDSNAIIGALRAKAAEIEPDEWVRAVGYDERAAGIPDRSLLDAWMQDRPLRLQDRTGALWALNSAALVLIGDPPWPGAVETNAKGEPTGRIWRGDDWMRHRIGHKPPSLGALSRQMARWGVTAVTDAGANNGPDEAAILSDAIRSGVLRQKLTLMGREDLPGGQEYRLGPVKLLFDERALPELNDIVARIHTARAIGRPVAAHCVTEAELVTYLAALEKAEGARKGDRIEHGSLIPHSLIADIAQSGLTVVSNPGFIARRGDRYLAEVDPLDLPNLQRLASLSANGVALLAGSDAPYGPANPWAAIAAAIDRRTPAGSVLGANEALSGDQALALFSGNASIRPGAVADCCLIATDWRECIGETNYPHPVLATFISGQLV
jgi:predicted amidohydrolase YtcJ